MPIEQINNENQENITEIEEVSGGIETISINSEALEGASVYSFETKGNLQDRQLDTLARLLTGNEICVAVCHYENKLLIASNKKRPKYAEEYLKNLQTFANEQNCENCRKLLELVIKQTPTKKKGKKAITQSIKDTVEKAKEKITKDKPITFRKAIKEHQGNPKKEIDFTYLQEAAQRTFDKITGLKNSDDKKTKANQKWSFLINWQDTGEIIEAIIRGELDERILERIKNMNLENDIEYIEFEDAKWNKLHAEMKIIDKLHEKKGEKCGGYIGISKLPCPSCKAVISILNKEGHSWNTYADESHGNPYDGWITPKIMEGRKKEIDEWKKANKSNQTKKETTSEIPKKLANVVQILEELKFQEQTIQIYEHLFEIPPKQTLFI